MVLYAALRLYWNLNRQKTVGNVMLPTACNVVCFFVCECLYSAS